MARRHGGRRFAPTKKSNLILSIIRMLAILLVLVAIAANWQSILAFFTDRDSVKNVFSIKAYYDIEFNSNDGTDTIESQRISFNVETALMANTFIRDGYMFNGWNTESDGSGTPFQDEALVTQNSFASVEGTNILYAQWVEIPANAVAVINGHYYETLQAAINAVPTDNTETLVELLKDTTENLIVAQNKNITFDLNNFTITNKNTNSVFKNSGTVRITNGTIKQTAQNESAFDNSSTGKLYISGGSIMMTNNNGKQAIYNNGGITEISGSAYLSSVGNQSNANNKRPAVHNLNGGTLTITGGTIVSKYFIGVKNDAGTLIIGVKGGESNNTTPIIQGGTYGVSSTPQYSYYDGIIKGKTAAVNNEALITDTDNLEIVHLTETIDDALYHDIILSNEEYKTVTFNPNGGSVSETERGVKSGEPIGTLPIPIQNGFLFDGWFTDPTDGTQIDENTIITDDITYYAHWADSKCFVVNGSRYGSLQEAVNAVPNNVQTTITLTRNVDSNQKATINKNQNIILDLGTYTINHTGNDTVVENKGTCLMVSGTIKTNGNAGAINNNTGADFTISGGSIIATGDRQAIYNFGNVLITGDAYLSSRASGLAQQQYTTLERATVQNLPGATTTITGGVVVSEEQQAISNDGTLIMGTKDGNINSSSPVIIGKTIGIDNLGTYNFYDGVVKGMTGTISGNVSDIEDNSHRVTSTEVIDGTTYYTEYIEAN